MPYDFRPLQYPVGSAILLCSLELQYLLALVHTVGDKWQLTIQGSTGVVLN